MNFISLYAAKQYLYVLTSAAAGFAVSVNTSGTDLHVDLVNNSFDWSYTFSTNQWYHTATVVNNSARTVTAYVNGSQLASESVGASALTVTTGTSTTGNSGSDSTLVAYAYLDEVCLRSGAVYTSTFTPLNVPYADAYSTPPFSSNPQTGSTWSDGQDIYVFLQSVWNRLPTVPLQIIVTGNYVKNSLNGKSIVTAGYTARIFTSGSSNTFSVSQLCTLQILCVGGGGGGTGYPGNQAGGAGAGGLVQSTTVLGSGDTLTVTVGAGGVSTQGIDTACSGGNSTVSFASNTYYNTVAVGGGGGNGGNSGSGGGGSWSTSSTTIGGTGTAGQGNSGGNGSTAGAGGGGGAATSGASCTGTGGSGKTCTLPGFDTSLYFAGGGGATTKNGGKGGGGNGSGAPGVPDSSSFYSSGSPSGNPGASGAPNSGGGGGGGSSHTVSGSGGSGVVVAVVQGTY